MEWLVKKLGEVADYYNGRAFKPSEWRTSGKPIIRIQNLNDHDANYNYSDQEYEERYKVQDGELLYAWSASLGAHIWKGADAWLNQHIFKVVPKPGVDKRYLYYFLCQVTEDLYRKTHGSGMVHITKKPFMNTCIPLPSIHEQRHIVFRIEELLSELDNSVSTLQKTKEQLAVYRQASITSAYPVITEENTKKLSEISDITGGITKGRDLKQAETIFLPYLRVANVQNGFLDLTEIKEIELKADEKEKYLLKKGDVLYTEGGDRDKLGRGTVWNEEIPDCVHQNHVFRARVDKSIAIPEYVAYWSMGSYARTYFFRKGKQTVNLASINKTVLSNLELPIPDLATQEKVLAEIESRVSVCNSIEQTVDTALQQAKAMRQSILKQAFEGRL